MNFKNKKGFITIYTMLAMMFFVLFVVVSAITASRKVQIQTEANTELYEIYNNDVSEIVLDEKTIPIYTKAQFLQIVNWLSDSDRITEYMYINDKVYTLDASRYEENGENHEFILETDIYLEGEVNDGDDKLTYQYIPKDIHKSYIDNMSSVLDINGHTIYVNVEGNNKAYKEEYLEFD